MKKWNKPELIDLNIAFTKGGRNRQFPDGASLNGSDPVGTSGPHDGGNAWGPNGPPEGSPGQRKK